jgi:hypothetical protein
LGVIGHERCNVQPPESALIDKPQLRLVIGKGDAHPQMRTGIHVGVLQQELPAHAEVGNKGVGVVVERKPEELAAPAGVKELVVEEKGSDRRGAASGGALMEDVDFGDGSPGDVCGKTPAHGFDFGKFGHVRWE